MERRGKKKKRSAGDLNLMQMVRAEKCRNPGLERQRKGSLDQEHSHPSLVRNDKGKRVFEKP